MSEPPPRETARFLLRAALAGVIVVLCVAGATATAALLKVKDVAQHIGAGAHPVFRHHELTPAEVGAPQTILLVGSDHRYGQAKHDARSDTLMLIHIDKDQRAIAALSVPRDLAVTIPGHGVAKINAAYSDGGLPLTVRTITSVLSSPGHPFRINHAITATFDGFERVVNYLHCVYVDVDRRYYHSNAGLPPSLQYSEINIQPGYQRLCGPKALAFVRYRHGDNDLVRAARQQLFVSNLKDQAGSNLLGKLNDLSDIFARTTETDKDLTSSEGLLKLVNLIVFSRHHAFVQVHFPAAFQMDSSQTGLGSYLTSTPAQIQATVRRFLHADSIPVAKAPGSGRRARHRPRGRHRRTHRAAAPTAASFGLVDSPSTGADLGKAALGKKRLLFPMYAPTRLTSQGIYAADAPAAPSPRIYLMRDRQGRLHHAYRFVILQNLLDGEYYGVQGTSWRTPPILEGNTSTYRAGGRTFTLVGDGSHLRYVIWRTGQGVYWVSNTLTTDLTNAQMIGIARSLTLVRR